MAYFVFHISCHTCIHVAHECILENRGVVKTFGCISHRMEQNPAVHFYAHMCCAFTRMCVPVLHEAADLSRAYTIRLSRHIFLCVCLHIYLVV